MMFHSLFHTNIKSNIPLIYFWNNLDKNVRISIFSFRGKENKSKPKCSFKRALIFSFCKYYFLPCNREQEFILCAVKYFSQKIHCISATAHVVWIVTATFTPLLSSPLRLYFSLRVNKLLGHCEVLLLTFRLLFCFHFHPRGF